MRLEPTEAMRHAVAIREGVSAQLAEDLDLTLWASEELIHDPVAISLDDHGVLYATQTKRDGTTPYIRRSRSRELTIQRLQIGSLVGALCPNACRDLPL